MRSLRDVLSRTPVQNRTPVPMAPRASAGLPYAMQRRDTETELRATSSVSTLFSIVSRLATATAKADWQLYRVPATMPDPAAPLRPVQGPHPARDLWSKPNPFMTTHAFVEAAQQHLDLTGETLWVIASDPSFPSIPLEMWPVRPDRMQPVPHPEEYLSGWIYTSPDGERIPLETAKVIQVKMPNPLDPYRGLGPVQALLVDLDSARYSAEWNRNFFINSAEPGGIIEIPPGTRLGDDEFREMSDRWQEQHQGISNAHRVAIIEHGKWVDRSYSQKDMQFMELRDLSRQIIREAYGIHPQFLGASDIGHSRAEAEAAEVIFASWLVVPRLDRIRGALNSQFMALFGDMTGRKVEFGYCSPVPGDEAAENAGRESRAVTFKTLVDAGVHPEDAALVAGLPPMRHTAAPAAVPVGGGQ
jgi:HK97 family phage portal protein